MAKPDKNKKQRITGFDFSHEEDHVAIVDRAANGSPNFLIKKSINVMAENEEKVIKASDVIVRLNDEMIEDLQEENKRIEDAMQNTVEIPLMDLLRMLGVWTDDAIWISELTSKAVDGKLSNDIVMKAVKKELEGSLAASNTEEVSTNTSKSKSENGETMAENDKDAANEKAPVEKELDETKEQAEKPEAPADDSDPTMESVLKQVADLQEKLDVYAGIEEHRIEKNFKEMANKYEDLGLTEDDGKVLRAVKDLEGSEVIFKALDSAVEFLSKKEATKEVGFGEESEVEKSTETDADKRHAKIQAIAKKYLTDNPDCGLTLQQAVVKCAEDDPDLVG